MAEFSAANVKDLRERSGAGMMDCKKALTETNGDMEAAIDWLRTKGLAKAAKKAGRVAAEGLVAVESAGHHAAIVEVNSETDFVARNDAFQAFAREAAKMALDSDTARAVAAAVKAAKLKKVQASIQGDQVRISSASRDELQGVIALLCGEDFGVELTFGNFR